MRAEGGLVPDALGWDARSALLGWRFYGYDVEDKRKNWGTWVAQSVERPTLGFSSGHDLMVREIEPCLGFSLSPSFFATPLLVHALSQNK